MTVLAAVVIGCAASVLLAVAVWALSVRLRDVSIVDIAWGWLVTMPALVAAAQLPSGPRAVVVLALATLWAARLSAYIAWRHRGQPEDRRYQAIRARNQPGFAWKSLYLVFGLQAVLGMVVALPLFAVVAKPIAWTALDGTALALAVFGLLFEAVADAQLARFKREPAHRGRVMDQGLWRYTRHPNYFGEFCFWWGIGLLGLATGAWWALASPVLMTVLLLKVSGVTLLESDLRERRPGYAEYVARTNAFFPGSPRP